MHTVKIARPNTSVTIRGIPELALIFGWISLEYPSTKAFDHTKR
jgi:hypothetical protein